MRIEDLTPYTYTRKPQLKHAIAIGWLGTDDMAFSIGETDSDVVNMLKQHEVHNRMKGMHCCEFCSEWGNQVATGNGELWVFGSDGKFFIAPYLIIHYIEDHKYTPPQEFISAVLNGFRYNSPGYELRLEEILKENK